VADLRNVAMALAEDCLASYVAKKKIFNSKWGLVALQKFNLAKNSGWSKNEEFIAKQFLPQLRSNSNKGLSRLTTNISK
jgi:hypothetical protein